MQRKEIAALEKRQRADEDRRAAEQAAAKAKVAREAERAVEEGAAAAEALKKKHGKVRQNTTFVVFVQ